MSRCSQITATIDTATYNELESIRGDIPRSTIVNDAIATYIEEIKSEID